VISAVGLCLGLENEGGIFKIVVLLSLFAPRDLKVWGLFFFVVPRFSPGAAVRYQ